jgi:hypothetical protein
MISVSAGREAFRALGALCPQPGPAELSIVVWRCVNSLLLSRRRFMTRAEEIMQAVATLVWHEGKSTFTRDEVRRRIGVGRDGWRSSYTAIFQGMRSDQPGGAPRVRAELRGAFQRVERGRYTLTDRGRNLLQKFKQDSPARKSLERLVAMVLYTANRPKRTLTLHKASCSHIPWSRLGGCGCGSTAKLGNQQWWCGEHITIETVNQFMNHRLWAILLCHSCYK